MIWTVGFVVAGTVVQLLAIKTAFAGGKPENQTGERAWVLVITAIAAPVCFYLAGAM